MPSQLIQGKKAFIQSWQKNYFTKKHEIHNLHAERMETNGVQLSKEK